jgi:hypothetical protein
MSKIHVNLRLGKDGTYSIDGASPSAPSRAQSQSSPVTKERRECPAWLELWYRTNLPLYGRVDGHSAAKFSEVRWWRDVRGYVGIYSSDIRLTDDNRQSWTQRYVWLYRDGRWTPIRQMNAIHGECIHKGWVKA